MNLNKAFLKGRLTRNPETKALPSGQSVTSFGMATDNFYTDKSGQKQQQTEFHNIVAFGRLAEISAQYLTKGSLVLVQERMRSYGKKWYLKNREKIRSKHREYYRKNKEKSRQYHKKWYKNNRENVL